MLCTLRSRRLYERAPSKGESAAPVGSTATSVTTPATRLGAAVGICLGPWLHSFHVRLPEHLTLKVLLDAARRLKEVVVPVCP
jgi:hypothetical protein